MAIAEHIGYNATGKKDKQNDLITIQKEYEKFKKKNNNITPIVFQIWNDELKNRADAYFYQPIFKELYKTLQTGKYSISKLSKIIDGDLIKGILPNQEEKEGDVNIIQISNVGRDGVIDASDCITAKREVYDEKHILKRNDILVVITGATIGKVGFWQEDKPDYYLGGDIVKFQVKKILTRYLFGHI